MLKTVFVMLYLLFLLRKGR